MAKAETMIEAAARLVVVTRGADGSLAFDGQRIVFGVARPVVPVDTTGAGESFIAGVIDARRDGRSLADCFDAGHAAAAVTCGHPGGFPQAAAIPAGSQAGGNRALSHGVLRCLH